MADASEMSKREFPSTSIWATQTNAVGIQRKRKAEAEDVPKKFHEAIRIFFFSEHGIGPLVVSIAIINLLVWRIFSLGPISLADPIAFAGTIVFWSLQEHVLHQKFLHSKIDWYGKQIHQGHHEKPYFHISIDPPALMLGWMGSVHLLFRHIFPLPIAISATLGYSIAGLFYEWAHFIVHTKVKPSNHFWKTMRNNHIRHHNVDDRFWLAFSLPLVDDFFGTNPPIAEVRKMKRNDNAAKTAPLGSSIAGQKALTKQSTRLFSTPFEADLYADDDDTNPFEKSKQRPSPLQVPLDTKLVIGLNKYSHDTTLCAANAKTGEVLFAISKERLSRRKHDSGNIATLVETCCDSLNLDLDAIETVVMNNHHHRILPLEVNPAHMEWEAGLHINNGQEDGYDDEENLLPNAKKTELSHHLAHAYSTAAQCPFPNGLIVIMDGMGETYRTMLRAKESNDATYVSDFTLLENDEDLELLPRDIREKSQTSYFDWREAESVYVFSKTDTELSVRPVFKRFTPENSAPTLYNHGFENMDSVGALYSRASMDIFGDWNACGKVMGLAPWMVHSWKRDGKIVVPRREEKPILAGSLYSEDDPLQIDRTLMTGVPLISRNDPVLFDEEGNLKSKRRYDFDDGSTASSSNEEDGAGSLLPTKTALDAITLAYRIQIDLESAVLDFIKHFQAKTGENNLCLAGGVALNSVLNGRLSRELGFEKTFIPPYPGDDGIAVGCCAYGLFGLKKEKLALSPWKEPLSPYLGPEYTEEDISLAIEDAAPWLTVDTVRNEDRRVELIAQEVESGGIVAWFHGRSELGPRALGHRSILADPRKKGLVRFINQYVKKRESFRPFAPSVLADEADKWFELGPKNQSDNNVSPYMSMTAFVKEDKRNSIPAVTHVDGSSRLQTVTEKAEPLYHKLISKFFERTGVPMVLNTSFNTLPGEPIVETPENAIRSFLSSMGSIEMLVMGDYVIKRKKPDLRKLLGETSKEGDIIAEPACPKRTGPVYFQSTFQLPEEEVPDGSIETVTKVRMPGRPMHDDCSEGWFELLDELEGEILSVCDGTVVLNEILAQYTASPEGKDLSDEDVSDSQVLAENVIHRLLRLYDHTLISW